MVTGSFRLISELQGHLALDMFWRCSSRDYELGKPLYRAISLSPVVSTGGNVGDC